MKKIIVFLYAFSVPAQAHVSLVPHSHPHGLSVLPGIDIIALGLLALAAVLIVYWKFRRTS
jgi:hypothetical protein